jgi:hypothetical protein
MLDAEFHGASPNAHLLIGEMPAPRQLGGRWREGTGLSLAVHLIVIGMMIYAAIHAPEVVKTASSVTGALKVGFLGRLGQGNSNGGPKTTALPRRPEALRPNRFR